MRTRLALLPRLAFPLVALVAVGATMFGVGCTGDDPVTCTGAECPNPGAGTDAGAGFELSTSTSVALVQGGTVQIDITVTRSTFQGPITATASQLPDGVAAQPLVIPAGAASAKLTLSALPNATQGTTPISVAASDAEGTIRRDRPASLLVRGPAGSLDTTFGTSGKVLASIGANGIAVRAAAVQSDGRILAAGVSDNDFVAARLDEGGKLDTSYGGLGIGSASVDLRNGAMASVDVAEGIALAPSGEAVLAGYPSNGAENSYGLARLTPAGKLDTAFDLDGYATPTFVKPAANNQLAFGVAVQADGKAVIAGTVLQNGGGTTDAVIARFKTNGAPDDTFGVGAPDDAGFFYGHSIAGTTNDSCEAVTIAPDGKIVAACSADDGGTHPVALRLTTNGQPDTGFGPGAKGFSPVPLPGATAHSIHVLPDGRTLMTGETADAKIFVVRLDTRGQLDTSFGPSGTIIVDIGTKIAGARSILDSSGRLVFAAATAATPADDHDLVVVRVTGDGKLDPSFATTGFVVTKLGAPATAGNARIAQASDGRIVAVTNLAAAPPKLAAIRLWP